MKQEKRQTIDEATKAAVAMSAEFGYACIIFSQKNYYIENETPFVRINETLVGEFENGKQKGRLNLPWEFHEGNDTDPEEKYWKDAATYAERNADDPEL